MLIAFASLWACDTALTLIFTSAGGTELEANPVMRYMLDIGPLTFVSVKWTLALPYMLLWKRNPLWLHSTVVAIMLYAVILGGLTIAAIPNSV